MCCKTLRYWAVCLWSCVSALERSQLTSSTRSPIAAAYTTHSAPAHPPRWDPPVKDKHGCHRPLDCSTALCTADQNRDTEQAAHRRGRLDMDLPVSQGCTRQ